MLSAASPENVIYLALELSCSTWLVAARLPGASKSVLHRVAGGDTAGLLELIGTLRARSEARQGKGVDVVSCFEAGRDGFWLHRLLSAHGIINHVVEPTSILVSRRARRAKTDRLDAEGLLRVLMSYWRGDRQICSVVRVPTPDEEDVKRQHREREHLVQERVRIENRMEALLMTQGIRGRPSLRSWERDLSALRTGDGRELPPHLRAELNRLHRRLILTLELIREIETERAESMATDPQDGATTLIKTSRASEVSVRTLLASWCGRSSTAASRTGVSLPAMLASHRCPIRAGPQIATGALDGPATRELDQPSFNSLGCGCAISREVP